MQIRSPLFFRFGLFCCSSAVQVQLQKAQKKVANGVIPAKAGIHKRL